MIIKNSLKIIGLILFCSTFIFYGCVSSTKQITEQTKISEESQTKNFQYPQMYLPVELDPWLDAMFKDGNKLIGSAVDNRGDMCLFFNDINGKCFAVVIAVTQGMRITTLDCDSAMYHYDNICIKHSFCNKNPYEGENL